MNLVIDLGNSSLKVALFDKNVMTNKFIYTNQSLNTISDLFKNNVIDNSLISNVSTIDKNILDFLKINSNLISINESTDLPFINLYKTKNTLGHDRIALVSAAAINFSNENVLIIDAGTCITYDFKNSKNEYLGGGISPGISMRFKSLNNETANLPLSLINLENKLIGDDTLSSINSGVVNGVIYEIEGVVQQYKDRFNNIRIILTGGDSNFLLKKIKNTIFADQNFLLKGLNYLLEINTK
ncbi:type III pantothenate kinase [Flavobacteriaceae bacterium]|nr:type III pantothenate kinase [Flavobacteriaceae bacterium]MDB4049720.1 type III pantothenate kinase [Flavobacteriaceae bacterium]MDB4086936.1 type III pantothenate kinase [Flavobacteriaceae bacterium]MDB4239962.1 type III pantothenate kinase [Flavobacteriaceae bacterium]MDB9787629.1 type III pantothenate kinase [Flavobacteriaceae bacterium]